MSNFKDIKEISLKAAIAALPKRGKIHCFAGSIGADWGRAGVVAELKKARRIAWCPNIFRHELAMEPGEKSGWKCVLHFDVRYKKK